MHGLVRAVRAVGPNQSTFILDSLEIMRPSDIQCAAEAEGLTKSTDDSWSCPICWSDKIQSHNLEQHMCSKYHSNYKAWEMHRISLETKKANGELPWWMDIQGHQEYCTICKKTAHHSHVTSEWHIHRLKNAEEQRRITHERSDGSDALTMSPPSHWGDHTLYKWDADANAFWCLLCWKFADDNHVNSIQHCNNVARRLDTSKECLQDVIPPPPPPPPPPCHRGTYTAAQSCYPLSGVHSERGDSSGYKVPFPSYSAQDLQTSLPPGLSQSACWKGSASDDDSGQSSDMCSVKLAPSLKSSLKQFSPSNPRWVRYLYTMNDKANPMFWWYCDNGRCFLESNPQQWNKYRNPYNDADFWLNSEDNTWFYVQSGSMDAFVNVNSKEKKVRFDQ